MVRRFPFKSTLFTVGLLLLPTFVWAASVGGSDRDPWVSLGLKFANFAILVGILYYFLRKPVRHALADRHQNLRKSLDDARKAKQEAEAKLAEYSRRVANLQQEMEQLQDQVREEAQRQKQTILAEAKEAAVAIRRQAEAAGTQEVKRAQDTLRNEAVRLAVQLAQDLLAKNYTAADQQQALQMTIKNVEEIH